MAVVFFGGVYFIHHGGHGETRRMFFLCGTLCTKWWIIFLITWDNRNFLNG